MLSAKARRVTASARLLAELGHNCKQQPWLGSQLHTSAVWRLKEIVRREEKSSSAGGVTLLEGVYVASPRKGKLIPAVGDTTVPVAAGAPAQSTVTEVPAQSSPGCPLCRLGIHDVKHTDVLVISQFMDRQGEMLPREVTGLCSRQHRLVSRVLYEAQRTGLIDCAKHRPTERWQELNNYFGRTRTKIDFGKPLIDIKEFLKKPSGKKLWEQ